MRANYTQVIQGVAVLAVALLFYAGLILGLPALTPSEDKEKVPYSVIAEDYVLGQMQRCD